jgi:hypothetical protein
MLMNAESTIPVNTMAFAEIHRGDTPVSVKKNGLGKTVQ